MRWMDSGGGAMMRLLCCTSTIAIAGDGSMQDGVSSGGVLRRRKSIVELNRMCVS